MRVLFVCSLYRPNVGGIETMILELCRAYKKRGIDCVVLTKKWPVNLTDFEVIDSIPVYRVNSARSESELIALSFWLKDNSQKIRADIIHVVGVRRPLPLAALLLRYMWNTPLVLTVAGGDIPDKKDRVPGEIWDDSKTTVYPVFNKADIITCVSKGVENDFRHFFPEVKVSVVTQYAPIDLDFIKNSKPDRIHPHFIISLRRLDPTKGIDILIRAFATIARKFLELKLVIAGDGPEKMKLEILTKKLGVEDKVDFIGTVSLERGVSLLKAAELTVVPSLSEGGGLVNIEAQAAGCPVVATNVGGIPEYVLDGKSGILCDPGDHDALSQAISLLLTDEEFRRNLIHGGLRHAAGFSLDNLVPHYISMYDGLIKRFIRGALPTDELFLKMWGCL